MVGGGKAKCSVKKLHQWLCAAQNGHGGVPFQEFESITSKLRHAFTSTQNKRGLMTSFNRILKLKPKFVFLSKNKSLLMAVRDCRTLLRISTLAPTNCRELVADWSNFIAVKEASGQGVRGIIVGEKRACVHTVFRYKWPNEIKEDLVS